MAPDLRCDWFLNCEMGNYSDALHDDSHPQSRYANYFRVGFNEFEFVLDLGEHRSEELLAVWHSRIVTAPSYTKEFARVLCESLEQYEARFGTIKSIPGR